MSTSTRIPESESGYVNDFDDGVATARIPGGLFRYFRFWLIHPSPSPGGPRLSSAGSIAKTVFETNTMFYDFHQVPYFKAFHNMMPS